jgi:hypothetical protein
MMPLYEISEISNKGKASFKAAKLRELIFNILGYYKYLDKGTKLTLVRIRNGIVEFCEDHQLKSDILNYMQYYNLHLEVELFLKSQAFISNIIQTLPEFHKPFLRGDKDTAYFPYKNGIVKVLKDSIQLISVNDAPGVIWAQQLINRTFHRIGEESIFQRFLFNVCNQDPMKYYSLCTIIGYLLHDYKDRARALAVIFLDSFISIFGIANGGTGKSLCTRGCKEMTPMLEVPGRRFDGSNKFVFQQVDYSIKILYLDDVSSDLRLWTDNIG